MPSHAMKFLQTARQGASGVVHRFSSSWRHSNPIPRQEEVVSCDDVDEVPLEFAAEVLTSLEEIAQFMKMQSDQRTSSESKVDAPGESQAPEEQQPSDVEADCFDQHPSLDDSALLGSETQHHDVCELKSLQQGDWVFVEQKPNCPSQRRWEHLRGVGEVINSSLQVTDDDFLDSSAPPSSSPDKEKTGIIHSQTCSYEDSEDDFVFVFLDRVPLSTTGGHNPESRGCNGLNDANHGQLLLMPHPLYMKSKEKRDSVPADC